MNLSPNEQRILSQLRELKAFERIEVVADKNGKPDQYMVYRSSKIILGPDEPKYTR